MDYARDRETGKIIAAEKATRSRSYVCPRPNCGGRVHLPNVSLQRPHFRHYPGEGTPACDEYFPGDGHGEEKVSGAVAAVEDDPNELGLVLTQLDNLWGIGLRLPEIPNEELGDESLSALLAAHVDIYSGTGSPLRVSAIDLRPGVGVARVEVKPSCQMFRSQPVGVWPETIQRDRWQLEAYGLEVKGVLFRLRLGEWTRLIEGSGVRLGETVLVLADAGYVPPVRTALLQRLAGEETQWCIWEVQLPNEPHDRVVAWLESLGHSLSPRSWCVDLVTPARRYSEGGVPFFWVKDSPVLALEAPQPSDSAMVELQAGTNSYLDHVRAARNGSAHVDIRRHDIGLARLTVGGDRGTSIYIGFERPPSTNSLGEQLARTPRLRIRVGMRKLEAWSGVDHYIPVPRRQQLDVQVNCGVDTARARVTVWERGMQRIRRGLDARGVERAISESLATASRIEIDAHNLGRLVLLPMRVKDITAQRQGPHSRLAWWDEIVGNASQGDPSAVPTVVGSPGSRVVAVRSADAAALVRARLSLRRRRGSGEDSK